MTVALTAVDGISGSVATVIMNKTQCFHQQICGWVCFSTYKTTFSFTVGDLVWWPPLGAESNGRLPTAHLLLKIFPQKLSVILMWTAKASAARKKNTLPPWQNITHQNTHTFLTVGANTSLLTGACSLRPCFHFSQCWQGDRVFSLHLQYTPN